MIRFVKIQTKIRTKTRFALFFSCLVVKENFSKLCRQKSIEFWYSPSGEEIEAGNEIDTIESDWPRKRSNIWLKSRFTKDYKEIYPSLTYRYLGDPRNWIEEYDDPQNEEFIAVSASAKFK